MQNFIAIALQGLAPKYVKYYAFVTFYCPVLSCPGYTFFSRSRAHVAPPGRILTVYGLNDASSPKDMPFGGYGDDIQF